MKLGLCSVIIVDTASLKEIVSFTVSLMYMISNLAHRRNNYLLEDSSCTLELRYLDKPVCKNTVLASEKEFLLDPDFTLFS